MVSLAAVPAAGRFTLNRTNATNQRDRTGIPAISTSLCYRSLFWRVPQMLFFLLLLAFLTIVVGLSRAACASRVIRAARARRWVGCRWCWQGTSGVQAIDLRGIAITGLYPAADRCYASTIGLAWCSPDGPPSSSPPRTASYEHGTHREGPLRRSCAGWSLTKLFMSGLRQTTFRTTVAPSATDGVPRLWR